MRLNKFLGATKKSGKSGYFYIERKMVENPYRFGRHRTKNRSDSRCSCIFQEPMHRGKYAYIGWWVNYVIWKVSCVSKIPTGKQKQTKNKCFRVPIYFAANHLTFEKFPPPPPLSHPIWWDLSRSGFPKRRNFVSDLMELEHVWIPQKASR